MGTEAEEEIASTNSEEDLSQADAVNSEEDLSQADAVKPDQPGKDITENAEKDETKETQPEFTQQQLDEIISKRVKRLNTKIDKKDEAASQTSTELALTKEKNKLLELALEQQREKRAVAVPNPDDFNEGQADPEYQKKQVAYQQLLISDEVAKQVKESIGQSRQEADLDQQAQQLRHKQVDHYKRSTRLEVTDYTATEDKAIAILGNETVNHIIDNLDDSEAILYQLGKNTQKAESLKSLLEENPIKGVAEIGRLSAELKIKPALTTNAPNPEDSVEGSSSSANEHMQSRLDELRDKAAKTGDSKTMQKIMVFKREAKAKGITLR